jgi:hypothetical protein
LYDIHALSGCNDDVSISIKTGTFYFQLFDIPPKSGTPVMAEFIIIASVITETENTASVLVCITCGRSHHHNFSVIINQKDSGYFPVSKDAPRKYSAICTEKAVQLSIFG